MKRRNTGVGGAGVAILFVSCTIALVGCPGLLRPQYVVDVRRYFSTPEEQALILLAEDVYPPREEVVSAVYPPGTDPEGLPENLWWYYGQFGSYLRLPYAITADAVEYYTQMVREDEENGVLEDPARWPGTGETLEYRARIQRFATFEGEDGESFTDVYVVTMDLSLYSFSGPLAAYGFSQNREVVLTPDGEVLRVYGDGPAGISIS